MTATIHVGDALAVLRTLPDASVHCCVTSPPYWGLRDYGVDGQLGLEETPQQFVAGMCAVFEEVRRVLRPDGVCWVNMGDSYASHGAGGAGKELAYMPANAERRARKAPDGLKPKDLVGIPWRLAFALQDAGWWLRSDCIWHKPNPMPESVTDRPTKAHEYVFLLTKSARYFYDEAAVRVEYSEKSGPQLARPYMGMSCPDYAKGRAQDPSETKRRCMESMERRGGANLRTVWTIPTQPFAGSHFATFPEALAERCIRAGCPEDGTVLDPFAGSGTTGAVALKLGRRFVGIELNPAYAEMARQRIDAVAPLFARCEVAT